MKPGLELMLRLADDELEAVEDYLIDRADADCDTSGYVPNQEMRLQVRVARLRTTLQHAADDLAKAAKGIEVVEHEAPNRHCKT